MKKIIVLTFVLMLLPCIALATMNTSADALSLTMQWQRDNGYDFPVYGDTTADLSLISDFLSLLEENGIYIKLPDLSIVNNDGYDRIYSKVADSFYLTYIWYFDTAKCSLELQVPRSYRPMDEALKLLMVYMLSMSEDEATKLYSDLQYNVIDDLCIMEYTDYFISYYEPRYSNGELMDFVSLCVEKAY